MKISVKILFGDEQIFQVEDETEVKDIKEMISERFHIPVENQKLLVNGRAMMDGNTLLQYNVVEGSKINCFVMRPNNTVAEPMHDIYPSSTQTLHEMLFRKLRVYYSDEVSKHIADAFIKDFYSKMAKLSMNDIEKLASEYLEEECIPTAEVENDSDGEI